MSFAAGLPFLDDWDRLLQSPHGPNLPRVHLSVSTPVLATAVRDTMSPSVCSEGPAACVPRSGGEADCPYNLRLLWARRHC